MTALAEALLAAQRQAIGALAKPYISGVLDEEPAVAMLTVIGCTDVVDRAQLLACWDILREYGAPAPTNGATPPPPKPMSSSQRGRIERTAKERNYPLPDFDNLSMAQASEVIQSMDDGSYDAAKWVIPF